MFNRRRNRPRNALPLCNRPAHCSGAYIIKFCRQPHNALRQMRDNLVPARINYYAVTPQNLFALVPAAKFFPIVSANEQKKFPVGITLFKRSKGVYRI